MELIHDFYGVTNCDKWGDSLIRLAVSAFVDWLCQVYHVYVTCHVMFAHSTHASDTDNDTPS